MSDDPAKPPRFPYVAAFFCAACLGAAGWTWMRYSYAWDMSNWDNEWAWRMLYEEVGIYGQARGTVAKVMSIDGKRFRYAVTAGTGCWRCLFSDDVPPCIFFSRKEERSDVGQKVVLKGRIVGDTFGDLTRFNSRLGPVIRVRASRFTGASIACLVVGAIGVFVLTVALRHWLKERRVPA